MPKPKGDFMTTRSGLHIWPLDPRPEMVEIYDIAHALAHTCRFSGHCRTFYSVAQHSVLASQHCPKGFGMWGLLHDAPEYILGDMIRPLKRCMPAYCKVEAEVMLAVAVAENLHPRQLPTCVKMIDNALLATEARDLMLAPVDWHLPEPAMDIRIKPWGPRRARMEFLRQYRLLKHGHPGTLWQQLKDYMGWQIRS